MKALFIALVSTALIGSAAHANAVSDASAGLASLQSGDNDAAIALFTRALGGGLRGDDREYAFACRGKAYLNKGDYSDAMVDLDMARRLKPDDTDAQNDLQVVLARVQPADLIPGRTTKSYLRALGAGLGQQLIRGLQQQQVPQ